VLFLAGAGGIGRAQTNVPQVTGAITATGGTCPSLPSAKTSFTSLDSQVWFDFTYTGGSAGDAYVIQWLKPDGSLYVSSTFTQTGTGGSYCYNYYISIAHYTPAGIVGSWNAVLTWNGTQIATVPFTIAPASNALITTLAGTIGVFPPSPLQAASAPLGQSYGVTTDTAGNVIFTDVNNHMIFRSTPGGTLTAIGGNGNAGYTAEGGAATAASFRTPRGVAVDRAGNVYVADQGNHRVRMISTSGIVTTVAGNGTNGYSGDGGAARSAELSSPWGVALDANGNLYIGDSGNDCIRKVDANGIISTFAGNGTAGFKGDGGPATSAELADPLSVTVDSAGNLYIADFHNNRIRKVALDGTISTIAGNGIAGYTGDGGAATKAELLDPEGVAVDRAGNVYTAESRNNRVRMISPGGTITTFAGNGVGAFTGDGGPATSASLTFPTSVAVSPQGTVFISDTDNKRIRSVNSSGTIQTLAGNGNYQYAGDGGPAVTAELDYPYGVATDATGNVYIADELNNRVRKVTPQGVITTYAGGGSVYGDNGPATSAALNVPGSVVTDAAGNLYINDFENFRIRKVTPQGIITTVAGNGNIGFAGDGGAATSAGLGFVYGIAVDSTGNNIYIASQSHNRIRRVSSSGVITTIAGTGVAGFSGDGGPATAAQIDTPWGVAVDSANNIYISDEGNHRIRRISATGIITTIAGTGTQGSAGIPGPASGAQIGNPAGLRVDSSGNLFFTDGYLNEILEISAAGAISVVAGGGPYTYSGDGGPAIGAGINDPIDLAVDNAGNLYIADLLNNRVRKVFTPTAALSFTAAPSNLTFIAVSGGAAPGAQTVSLSSTLAGFGYSVLTAGANWLSVTPSTGTIPATLQVSVNPGSMAPGVYSGIVAVAAGTAVNPVHVTLNVLPAPVPKLGVDTTLVTMTTPQGGAAQTQTIHVANTGGGSLPFTATASTVSGGSWLSISSKSGTATASSPIAIGVVANPASLAPGTYAGSVTVTGGGSTITIPVTLSVTPPTASILVSQSGLTFTAVAQGGAPLPQNIGVLNSGQGSLNWTAQAKTLSGGNWLSITPTSGSVATPFLSISLITVSVNPANMAAGTYYGTVQVSGLAINTPQLFTVILNILPVGFTPGPQVFPSGLIFTGTAGATPGSQDVMVGSLSANSTSYLSGVIGTGFTYAPVNAVLLPNRPASVRVYPDFTNFGPGIQRGTITLQFADGSPSQTISLLFSVAAGAALSTQPGVMRLEPQASGSCGSQPLQVVFRSPQPLTPFSVALGQSLTIDAQISDACGNLIGPGNSANGLNVQAVFSDKEIVNLTHIGQGVWQGNWKPASAGNFFMQIDAIPTLLGQAGGQTSTLSGTVSAPATVAATTPTITAQGVVHAASDAGGIPIAPGELITVYGLNLADGVSQPNALPLPSLSSGAQVLLGNTPLPVLYTSTGQLNVQVPYSVPLNTPYQLSVVHNATISVPQQVVVAAAQPGIFTLNQAGTGQGDVLKSDGVTLAQAGTPASIGETVIIYCTGLGIVSPAVTEGVAPTTASRTVNPVTATIGGVNAPVAYAGVTPGYPGLYQVNAVVPSGITTGNAVPVTLTVAGQTSATVTMAVH
jgi:uncharacterized protein (TIGR03437 family)